MIEFDLSFTRGAFTLQAAYRSSAPITGVFGPSGAGKSTLIRSLAGLDRPDHGVIALDGEVLFDSARHVHVPAHRRRIGVVFQDHCLFPHLSAAGNLRYGQRGDAAAFEQMVSLLELAPLLDRSVEQLSGGERQRVALGRALLSAPRLLLLDEPLSSMDHRLRRQIFPYLERIRDEQGTPMMHVSHELPELLRLTDQLLVLDRGRAIGAGRLHELTRDGSTLDVLKESGIRSFFRTTVVSHHPEEGVSALRIERVAGAHIATPPDLFAPLCSAPIGSTVIASLEPGDVALARSAASWISIQNQVPARVVRVSEHVARCMVEVDIGVPLLVEVSRRSLSSLGIAAGSEVVCLFKSHAIRIESGDGGSSA